MISVSEKNWAEHKINKNLVKKIKQDFKFNEIISQLIVLRNFDLNIGIYISCFYIFISNRIFLNLIINFT